MQYLQVLGNLGSDAEVRDSNGQKFVSFKVADSQRFTDSKGVVHESTVWVSCAWNGDGGKLLPFLRKGTKVLVMGRPSYKVFSSEKERCVMAGVDLHVFSVELAGGSSDVVPRRLVDPSTGALINVAKYYWVQGYANCQLVAERGGAFIVDAQGFVKPAAPAEQAAPQEQSQQADDAPFVEEQAPEAAALASKMNNKKQKKHG